MGKTDADWRAENERLQTQNNVLNSQHERAREERLKSIEHKLDLLVPAMSEVQDDVLTIRQQIESRIQKRQQEKNERDKERTEDGRQRDIEKRQSSSGLKIALWSAIFGTVLLAALEIIKAHLIK